MWEELLRKVVSRVEGRAEFAGVRWFRSQSEYGDFAIDQIPDGQFQWFIDILIHLKFVTEETVSTAESHRDEFHAAKVINTKEQSIVAS